DCDPSLATQRTFLVVAMSISSEPLLICPASNESGSPFSSETMLRELLCPHIGQSPAPTSAGRPPTSKTESTPAYLKSILMPAFSVRSSGAPTLFDSRTVNHPTHAEGHTPTPPRRGSGN